MKLRLAALVLAAMCVAGTASAGANDSNVKDGDECEIRELGLCGENHEWEITDEDLLTCQVETGD